MITNKTTPAWERIVAVARLGRPRFLLGGIALNGLGAAMALYVGAPLDWVALLWGQVAITCTQLMTHFANEYFDLAADLANPMPTQWSGGSRVLPEGAVQPKVALLAARVSGAAASGAAIVLATVVGPSLAALAVFTLALVLAWEYSAPPLRLHSRGLGEITVALLVPGLTPIAGFYLQTGRLEPLPVLAVLPLCLLQIPVMLAVEVPDIAGDAAVGKRTLPVRLSIRGAARLHNACIVAAYALLPCLVLLGLPWQVALAASLSAPVAAWQAWRVRRGAWSDPASWESLAFTTTAVLMGTAALEFVAFLLLLYNAGHEHALFL